MKLEMDIRVLEGKLKELHKTGRKTIVIMDVLEMISGERNRLSEEANNYVDMKSIFEDIDVCIWSSTDDWVDVKPTDFGEEENIYSGERYVDLNDAIKYVGDAFTGIDDAGYDVMYDTDGKEVELNVEKERLVKRIKDGWFGRKVSKENSLKL